MTEQSGPARGAPALVFERRTGWTGDPFWDEVRRRCPDLPIVLLPPEPAPASYDAAPPDPRDDDDLLALVRSTGVLATALLRTARADETVPEVAALLRPTTGGATVLASTSLTELTDGAAVLARLGDWLRAPGRGWAVREGDGPVRVLTAARGPHTVTVRWNESAATLVLDVRHARLAALPEQVRRLRAALREHAAADGGAVR